jgi:Type III secretion system lipoprotein chaperone (YscW)
MGVVTGRIFLEGWQGEPGPAMVYVRVLDTSRADASAVTVSTLAIRDVALDLMDKDGIDFSLDIPAVDPRTRYTVSVLVDLNGDGQSSPGDYRSMQAYPVLTHGHGNRVEVHARRIL